MFLCGCFDLFIWIISNAAHTIKFRVGSFLPPALHSWDTLFLSSLTLLYQLQHKVGTTNRGCQLVPTKSNEKQNCSTPDAIAIQWVFFPQWTSRMLARTLCGLGRKTGRIPKAHVLHTNLGLNYCPSKCERINKHHKLRKTPNWRADKMIGGSHLSCCCRLMIGGAHSDRLIACLPICPLLHEDRLGPPKSSFQWVRFWSWHIQKVTMILFVWGPHMETQT